MGINNKPTIGGSDGTWGTELNSVLDAITPMTAVGDMLYASAVATGNGIPQRLPIGANNQILTSNGSIPTWASNIVINGTLTASSGTTTLGTTNTGTLTATAASVGVNAITTTANSFTDHLGIVSSSILASRMIDETGSGSLVFNTSPTFTGTVNLGTSIATGSITTAINSASLGGQPAASYALLNGPTFMGGVNLGTASGGTIGGWTVSASSLNNNGSASSYAGLQSASTASYVFFAGGQSTSGSAAQFSVAPNGNLISNSASIAGVVTFTSGTIGPFTVSSTLLSGSSGNISAYGASFTGQVNLGTNIATGSVATAINSASLGGIPAASYAQLGSPIFTGNITASSGTITASNIIVNNSLITNAGIGIIGGATISTGSLTISIGSLNLPIGSINATNGLNSLGHTTFTGGTPTEAPMDFTSGSLLSVANGGAIEYDGKAFYITPEISASGGRGIVPSYFFTSTSAVNTLTNNIIAQNIFPTTNDTIFLAGSTTYEMEMSFQLFNSGSVAHALQLNFGGNIGLSSIGYTAIVGQVVGPSATFTASSISPSASTLWSTSSTSQVLAASTASTVYRSVFVKGLIRTNTTGSFIPQIILSASPTGLPIVQPNAYMKITPLGLNTLLATNGWS
jgi:hypothetical protein